MLTTIFGYGSLINTQSLEATVQNPGLITPSYIKGFIRSFNLWDELGFTVSNEDVAGVPFCALDVTRVKDNEARVNGITFAVNETQLHSLLKREHDYSLIKTAAYSFETNEVIGESLVFIANKNNGEFVYNSEPQIRYLNICLDGSKEYGEKFYKEFLKTTFIGKKPILKMPELISKNSVQDRI